MSEAILSAKQQSEPATPEKPRPSALPALLLVQCLFLLVLVTGAFFGWQLWQQYGLLSERETQQKTYLAALQDQLEDSRRELHILLNRPDTSSLQGRINDQQKQLEQLEQSQKALQQAQQNEQQQLKQHIANIGAQHRWQLNEAFYQMRLAHLRLSVMQDVDSARLLLKNADELLMAQQDPASLATRKQLAEALQQLQILSQLDRSALYLKLAALRSEAEKLSQALPTFTPSALVAKNEGQASFWDKWRETMAHYVRIDFDASAETIRPLLAGQQLAQARLALTLALEQAQWAVLHGEQAVYQQALKQAGQVLLLTFNPQQGAVQSLQTALNELAAQPATPAMPDLAPLLAAMQLYLQQHQQAEAGATQPASAAATAETTP